VTGAQVRQSRLVGVLYSNEHADEVDKAVTG